MGGDFGTTTGNAYASFLYQNSISVLGLSNQQYQVDIITQNSECSMLYFSVYSNESNDILFLTTQNTSNVVESARDYYIEYILCMELKIHYDIVCDDSESIIQDINHSSLISISFLVLQATLYLETLLFVNATQ